MFTRRVVRPVSEVECVQIASGKSVLEVMSTKRPSWPHTFAQAKKLYNGGYERDAREGVDAMRHTVEVAPDSAFAVVAKKALAGLTE